MTQGRKVSALGLALRRARDRAGLSQWALADKSGVSRATISNLEAGVRDNAQVETIEALAGALGVDSRELLAPMPSGVAEVEPLLRAFLAGPAARSIRPTPEEIEWLRSLPGIYWAGGSAPTEMTIYHLILAYRSSGG